MRTTQTKDKTEIAMLNATRGLLEGLHRHGALTDEEAERFAERRERAGAEPLRTTMRRFDADCLTPSDPMTGADIAALRERERVSQTVLARTLGVSLNTVSQWERGERRATGAALKLLSLAKAHGLDHVK